ncbi:MAG: flavodoxin domain-containing protein [Anaerolineae bacterium]|jgi:menaquinone-dependent protoporphyrinogen oxidase|nr:flavodoxin domain-containing protein [Anaerolineae bacterium]
MSKKVLIIYGSWLGSTKQIADALAESMRAEGAAVDVLTGKEVKGVDGYDGVIIGSAVRMGGLHNGMKRPVRKFASQLKDMPVAGFVGCGGVENEEGKSLEAEVKAYLTKFTDTIPGLKLIDIKPIAGVILLENARGLMKLMAKSLTQAANYRGDQRDWDAIAAWAKEMLAKF